MKSIITLLLSLSLASLSAQIVNSNFENWIEVEGAPTPQGWEILSQNDQPSVTQDLDAYEGMYAVQVEAIPIELGAYGNASTVFDINYIPSSLDFYVKAASEFGGVSVEIVFYNGEEMVESYWWNSGQEVISQWTFISLPLESDDIQVTSARIDISASVGDFAPGSAVISVDQMSFGTIISLTGKDHPTFNLYPNPAGDFIRVENSSEMDHIEIRDMSGQLVRRISNTTAQNEISIQELAPASYTVVAHLKSGATVRQKLVVAR